MKFQNNNIDQLSEELNELKLKIAKMNARRNAQIELLEKDLDGRYWRGTFLKPHHVYPSSYYDHPSGYRYPSLYPRYRSLENLLVSESHYPKPAYRKTVAFSTTDRNDNNSNLKSNVPSASMSDLLGKLKDFVYAQEKQLTDDLLNKIAQSRRPPRATTSCSNLTHLTKSGPFLNPVNKKDNFYKRYNTFAKRVLKPLPATPSTNRNPYTPSFATLNTTPRSWLSDNEYDYWYDEPRWTRWYRRYLTSPRYHHYLSDYNYYIPKSFTLPPDVESIVGGTRTKCTDRTYNCRSISSTPDSKLQHPNKYDPSESDSYLKPRLPNWKQYYYTHKLKTKPSKESYLQYYDPHYDFFPDAASVDSTDELLLDTSSAAVKDVELHDEPEQLINDYRDAIYEDVIQNLRTKQQRPYNTFPRRKPRRVERSLSPATLSPKRNNADWDVVRGSRAKYDFDAPPSSTKNFLYTKNTTDGLIPPGAYDREFTTNFSEKSQPVATTRDVYTPSYLQQPAEDVKSNGLQTSECSPEKENPIPARMNEEFLTNFKFDPAVTDNDVGRRSHQQSENGQQSNVGTRDFVSDQTSEEKPSLTRRALVFSGNARKDDLVVRDEVYKPVHQSSAVTEYDQQRENCMKFSTSVSQSSGCNERLENERPPTTPSRTTTITGSWENTKGGIMGADPNVYRPSYQQPTARYAEQFGECTKPSNRDGPQNENTQPARISQEPVKFNKTNTTRQLRDKNDIIQSDPNTTSARKNFTILQRRNSNYSAPNQSSDVTRGLKTLPQQLSADPIPRTESTAAPWTHDSHYATSTRPTYYANNYSNPNQYYPEVFDSNNSMGGTPAFIVRRRSSQQLIALPPASERENISSTSSAELLDSATTIRSRPALLRKRSSQLIVVPQTVEECELSNIHTTEPLVDSTNSIRSSLLRRRSSQLISRPSPSEEENISGGIVSSTTPLSFTNSIPASLRRRSSQLSQMIASPALLGQENIPIASSEDPSLGKSEWGLVKKSSDANRAIVSSFRRQSSTKLTPSVPVSEQDLDVEKRVVGTNDRRLHNNTDQFAEYTVDIREGDEMRDSDKNASDFGQPIYEQPREEKNVVDYYYDSNCYPPNVYEADPRYYEDVSRQPIEASTVPYDERQAEAYDPYEQSYYIQNDYYNQQQSDENNYPEAGYDLNRRPETYYPRVQNYDNYENVNYVVEDEPQRYGEASYDSNNVAGDKDTRCVLDTFPEEYAVVENSPPAVPATAAESVNEPSPEELEGEESTSIAEVQPSESAEDTKKPTAENVRAEEVTRTSGSKINNARDGKKSVAENSETRNREPISRRASKISLQSAKVQPTAAESQKRAPKIKQVENKLKRTASTVSRTKTPSTKRT